MPVTIAKIIARLDTDEGQIVVGDLVFGASYPHGGEPVTAELFGFRVGTRLDSVSIESLEATVFGMRCLKVPPAADHPLPIRLYIQAFAPAPSALSPPDRLLTCACLDVSTLGDPTTIMAGRRFTKIVAGASAEVAAQEVAFTAGAHDIAADPDVIREAFYLYTVDAAGTISVTKGTEAEQGLSVPPPFPANEAVLGFVTIQVLPGATPFDAGTDDLTAGASAHLQVWRNNWNAEAEQGTNFASGPLRFVAVGR